MITRKEIADTITGRYLEQAAMQESCIDDNGTTLYASHRYQPNEDQPMLNDRQLAQVNAARAAKGKRPITTQLARQNPLMTNWLKFWTDYELPVGDKFVTGVARPVVTSGVNYNELTLDELKEKVRLRGLQVNGTQKSDYVAALKAD